jgi:hypothetical protein
MLRQQRLKCLRNRASKALHDIYKSLFVDVAGRRLLKVNTLDNRLFLRHYAAQLGRTATVYNTDKQIRGTAGINDANLNISSAARSAHR